MRPMSFRFLRAIPRPGVPARPEGLPARSRTGWPRCVAALRSARRIRAAVPLGALIWLSACAWFCAASAHAQAPAPVSPRAPGTPAAAAQLVAFGDLRGELLPCGCSPDGQFGGLPRREGYWNALLRGLSPGTDAPVLVDLGNNFPEPSAQGRLKIEVIQPLLGKMPLAAILPGPNELRLGLAALDRNLPYLVTNNDVPGAFLAERTVPRPAGGLVILGYLSPGLVYQGSQDRFRLTGLNADLLERYRALIAREPAQQAVLLFRGSDEELVRFAASGLFGAIIAGNPSGDELTAPTERRVAGYRIPQVPTKGQGAIVLTTLGTAALGALEAGAPAGSAPAAGSPPRVDLLKEGIPDGPAALAALKVYDARVKALFFQELRIREASAQDSPYAGAQACQACHQPAFATWQASRHAGALRALDAVGKQFDPECLDCHVAGFDRGGFVSGDATPHLAGVQCESCHGPAKRHQAEPERVRLPAIGVLGGAHPEESTCRSCHRGAHSPKFSFADYWPRIRHGAQAASR